MYRLWFGAETGAKNLRFASVLCLCELGTLYSVVKGTGMLVHPDPSRLTDYPLGILLRPFSATFLIADPGESSGTLPLLIFMTREQEKERQSAPKKAITSASDPGKYIENSANPEER